MSAIDLPEDAVFVEGVPWVATWYCPECRPEKITFSAPDEWADHRVSAHGERWADMPEMREHNRHLHEALLASIEHRRDELGYTA